MSSSHIQKPEELVNHPKVKSLIEAELKATGSAAKLRGFEYAKRFHLSAEDFSVENGLLTPTFKLKRFQAQKHYKAQIDAMYAGEDAAIPSKL